MFYVDFYFARIPHSVPKIVQILDYVVDVGLSITYVLRYLKEII